MDDETVEQLVELLELTGAAQAADETLDVGQLARKRGVSDAAIRQQVEYLEDAGLLFGIFDEECESPLLRDAGRQYLARHGEVPREILCFLPHEVDDLNARESVVGGRNGLGGRISRSRASRLVPPAFEQAVTERLALDLFAAAVALLARLSDGRPAGCVAEETLAVGLIGGAKSQLEIRTDRGELTETEATAAATAATSGLFELFEDDDVLYLFDMREPADAAIAGQSPINREAGIADQRLESWFEPFTWTIPTGYLGK